MSHSEFQQARPRGLTPATGPWGRADASVEVARAAEALARELADRLGWKVKVEVTGRLGGQMACAAVRATPRDAD